MASSRNHNSITVFTPTYNRGEQLRQAFESIQGQATKPLEWIVLDDGSTDDTRAIVGELSAAANFPVVYHHQANRGMHIAVNRGVGLAKGEFFLKLDSDDQLADDALGRLLSAWEGIEQPDRDRFCAVKGSCVDQNGEFVGDRFPEDVLDSNTLEKIHRYRVRGDKKGLFRTQCMREFPFAETPFLSSNPWYKMARRYQTRYVNEVFYVYFQGEGGIPFLPGKTLARRRPSSIVSPSGSATTSTTFGSIQGTFFRRPFDRCLRERGPSGR